MIVYFLLLWIAYAWMWNVLRTAPPTATASIRAAAPTFRQNCADKEVPCIDDCSFLCLEHDAKCVGGVCETELQDIPCNEEKGGVRMMVQNPVPRWVCVCTDSRFFGGEECDTLHPDVCEHGVFMYRGKNCHMCLCMPPYELMTLGGKEHCVEKKMLNFDNKDE